MYVCMYACMYVCMYVCTCMHVHKYACMLYLRLWSYIYVCIITPYPNPYLFQFKIIIHLKRATCINSQLSITDLPDLSRPHHRRDVWWLMLHNCLPSLSVTCQSCGSGQWADVPLVTVHLYSLHSPPGGVGGGGGTSICMHIGYVPRERPPFSALNFRSGAYHFHKLPKNQSVPEHHHFTFLADFAVPETIIFKISLIWTRSSPPTAGSARTQSVRQRRGFAAVPEIRIFTLKTDQARSGDSHFHGQKGSSSFRSTAFQAQNGSSSFRSPTFSRSTGSPFRSPCPFFTLPRHIPTKIWDE